MSGVPETDVDDETRDVHVVGGYVVGKTIGKVRLNAL